MYQDVELWKDVVWKDVRCDSVIMNIILVAWLEYPHACDSLIFTDGDNIAEKGRKCKFSLHKQSVDAGHCYLYICSASVFHLHVPHFENLNLDL